MMPEALPASDPSTVAALQSWGRERLHSAQAARESELLLGHALKRERAWLFAHAGDTVAAELRALFVDLIAQRVRGVPVAQLLGAWGFWSLDLRVTADTLIPRPETELLIEAALDRLPSSRPLRVADLGTGTGAIALALARERPQASVLATDASVAALEVACDNARRNEIANVEFRHGDWYAPLHGERFDLIASNPPYISECDAHLEQGDLRFEPRSALASGADGLDAIRVLASGATMHLLRGGWLLVEHGYDQGAAVRTLFAAAGLSLIETRRDLEDRERVTLGASPS